MAINYLKIRSALKDLRPEWLLELRPRRNRITRQSCLFSVPNGDLEFEFHPSPPTPLIRSFRGQSWSQFLSPQAIAFELQSRLIGGLNRCKRSSLRPSSKRRKAVYLNWWAEESQHGVTDPISVPWLRRPESKNHFPRSRFIPCWMDAVWITVCEILSHDTCRTKAGK
jgi:hypothetical protein